MISIRGRPDYKLTGLKLRWQSQMLLLQSDLRGSEIQNALWISSVSNLTSYPTHFIQQFFLFYSGREHVLIYHSNFSSILIIHLVFVNICVDFQRFKITILYFEFCEYGCRLATSYFNDFTRSSPPFLPVVACQQGSQVGGCITIVRFYWWALFDVLGNSLKSTTLV